MKDKVYAKKQLGPRRDKDQYQHIATAELHSIGNQEPYFSITVDTWSPGNISYSPHAIVACGCQHDIVSELFPEWDKYLKWHLTSTKGPMHYIANTVYHASDRDCNGLLKGEKRQLVNGRTKLPVWQIVVRDTNGVEVKVGHNHWEDSAKMPSEVLTVAWEPVWIVGEGKVREFDAARSSACWPEATDEQLSLPKEELTKLLEERHPALMAEFQKDMLELFGEDTWSNWKPEEG